MHLTEGKPEEEEKPINLDKISQESELVEDEEQVLEQSIAAVVHFVGVERVLQKRKFSLNSLIGIFSILLHFLKDLRGNLSPFSRCQAQWLGSIGRRFEW